MVMQFFQSAIIKLYEDRHPFVSGTAKKQEVVADE